MIVGKYTANNMIRNNTKIEILILNEKTRK